MAKDIIDKSELNSIKSILILGHSNIGDVCYDLAVVEPIRKYFPRSKIAFLTSPKAKDIIEVYGGIYKTVILDKRNKHKGLFKRIRFSNSLNKERFDLIVVLNSTLMQVFLKSMYIWDIYHTLKADFASFKKHPVDIYLKYLRSKGLDIAGPEFNFVLDKKKKFCDDFLEENGVKPGDKLVGIMPMAAWAFKNWPVGSWNELAGVLKREYGIKTIAFGRSGSGNFSQSVIKNISPEIISSIDKTDLGEALALIKYCDIFIGPDSSLLHLASCLNVESIGLYGPTPPDYVYPYFHRNNLICADVKCQDNVVLNKSKANDGRDRDSMRKIPVNQVLEMVKSRMSI